MKRRSRDRFREPLTQLEGYRCSIFFRNYSRQPTRWINNVKFSSQSEGGRGGGGSLFYFWRSCRLLIPEQCNPTFELTKPLSKNISKGYGLGTKPSRGKGFLRPSRERKVKQGSKVFQECGIALRRKVGPRRAIGTLRRELGAQRTPQGGNQDLDNKLESRQVIRSIRKKRHLEQGIKT